MKFFTYTLSSGSLEINAADGALTVSIQSKANSTTTVLGGIPFKQISSSTITLSDGQGLTISVQSPATPIDGVVITSVTGEADIIIGF